MKRNRVLLIFLLALCNYVSAILVNKTIDDRFGDTTTSREILYFPATVWNDGPLCKHCAVHPDAHRFFKRTWRDSAFVATGLGDDFPNTPRTASVMFNGTAVYVICALSREATRNSDMSFFIDNRLAGNFTRYAPKTDGFDYNVTVFAEKNLSPMEHNITIQNGRVDGPESLMLLDVIIYTQDDGKPEPSSSTSRPKSSAKPLSFPNTLKPNPAFSSSPSPSSASSMLMPSTASNANYTSSSSPKTVIIAAVMGSVCGVVLIAFLLYWRPWQTSDARAAIISPHTPYTYPSMSGTLGHEEDAPPSYEHIISLDNISTPRRQMHVKTRHPR